LHDSAEERHIVDMPATEDRITTIAQLLALPEDGKRHELLDGVHVVTPAPSRLHQRAVGYLHAKLHGALEDREDVEVLSSPADIVLGPKTLVQPDLFVIAKSPGDPGDSWSGAGTPFIAIEILSASTAARDRGVKRRLYQHAGVAEYWIVDLEARLVERWTPDDQRPAICDAVLDWQLPVGVRGQIDVVELFRSVVGK
jgi:Uma2 family endonuclease